MVLEHDGMTTEDPAELLRRLLDDADVWDGVDDPLSAMVNCVPDREVERCQRLPTTRWHSQGEDPWRIRRPLDRLMPDIRPELVDRPAPRQSVEVAPEGLKDIS